MREELIEEYLPVVKKIALKMKNKLPKSIELDDLIGAGVVGLIEAVRRYDPRKDRTFRYFAELKIRGAMIDYLRSIDVLPRNRRRKIKELEEMWDKLAAELGRDPEIEEITRKMGMEEEELVEIMKDASIQYMYSLSDPLTSNGDDNGYTLLSVLEDPEDPPTKLEEQEFFKSLIEAIDSLTEREKILLSLYYEEGFTLKEIGKVLGITESRVCQIHWRAIKKIKEFLQKKGYEVANDKSSGS